MEPRSTGHARPRPQLRRRPPRRRRRQQVQLPASRRPPRVRPPADPRQHLGGFANLRPSLAFEALASSSPLRPEVTKDVDILFVRELLGGLYFGAPRWWNKDTNEAINTMRYTKAESHPRGPHRLRARRKKRRSKVTSVDKANVLEVSQLWRGHRHRGGERLPLRHPRAPARRLHGHAPHERPPQLRRRPHRETSSATSSPTNQASSPAPSACSPQQPSAEKLISTNPCMAQLQILPGTGKANPLGAILTAAMVLRHSAHLEADAKSVEQAVHSVLEAGYRTTDIAQAAPPTKTLTTQQMGKQVHQALVESIDPPPIHARRLNFAPP